MFALPLQVGDIGNIGIEMKSRCPQCGHDYDLLEVEKDRELRALLEAFIRLGSHGRIVKEYMELFEGKRRMSIKKRLRLVREVENLLKAERFEFNRRVIFLERLGILAAMKEVCNRDLKTLTNHNYLKTVMASVAEKMSTERLKEADRKHRKKEDRARRGVRPGDRTDVRSPVPEEIRRLTGSIGNTPRPQKKTDEDARRRELARQTEILREREETTESRV